jgi:GNAT superfamily N-acetyltransferase
MALYVKELKTEVEWCTAYPVMHELRTHLTEEKFISLMHEMADENYQLFTLIDEERIQSLAGVAIRTNLYALKHIYVYDLVTTEHARSKGYGEKLLSFLEMWGREQGCTTIALESGVQRTDAHRFYEKKLGFDRTSYSFRKQL